MDLQHLQSFDMIPPLSGEYRRQNFSCIYAICSKINGKIYIGSAKHFGIRRRNHIHALLKMKHHSIILQNHVNKHGIEDLVFFILERCCWGSEIVFMEQKYMNLYCPEFNILKTAGTTLNRVVSKETRQRQSIAQTGKKQSAESIEKKRLSCISSMKLLTEQQKENRKRGGFSKRKKVICNETGSVYESIAAAEKETGCDNIWQIINGTRSHSLGLTFSLYEL